MMSISSSSPSSSVSANQLWSLTTLRNDYVALRHGQSTANVAGIIASDPGTARSRYGLSPAGRRQAAQAGADVVEAFRRRGGSANCCEGVAILTSDLLRARETAEIVKTVCLENLVPVHRNDVIIERRLRERGFGDWDGTSDSNYEQVWRDDAISSSHEVKGVESVDSVMRRATQAVREWDESLPRDGRRLVVCTAHGDVLQILQTAFCKMDGTKHRELEHLETAKLRPLLLAGAVQ
jgi:probable phosphoglycerate mutase